MSLPKEKIPVRLSYDLLQVPDRVKPGNIAPPLFPAPLVPPVQPTPVLGPARPKAVRKRQERLTREYARDPFPRYAEFSPQWVDMATGVQYSLADASIPLVQKKRLTDKGSIVFIACIRGRDDEGLPRRPPMLRTMVRLTEISTGKDVGYGYVSEAFFEARRVTGAVVLNPVYWDETALSRINDDT